MSDNIDSKMKDKNSNDAELRTDEAITKSTEKGKKVIASEVSNTQVAVRKELTQDELALLDYTNFDSPARMLELGKVLAKSQLVPLKKPEDVVVALMTGKELGLPFVTSVSQIYPINGRPTLGVHIQKALCLQHGVVFQKIEDAIDIYEYVEANEDGTPVMKSANTPKVIGKGTIEEQPKGSLKRSIDRRTTYLFTREIKMPSGKFKEVTAKGSFSLSEAREAELLDKDVWKKYWRRMLDARAFTNGAGEIADDITLGLRAPNEVSSNYYINTDGEEVQYAEVVN